MTSCKFSFILFYVTLCFLVLTAKAEMDSTSFIQGNQRPHHWFDGLGHFHRWLMWQATTLIRLHMCSLTRDLLVTNVTLLEMTWCGSSVSNTFLWYSLPLYFWFLTILFHLYKSSLTKLNSFPWQLSLTILISCMSVKLNRQIYSLTEQSYGYRRSNF